MEYGERQKILEENINNYMSSMQREAQVVRDERQKRNVYHGNMIQLYKSKNLRKHIVNKAKKKHLDGELIEKAEKIANKDPFDTKTVSVDDLECLKELEIFVEEVRQENILLKVWGRVEELVFGSNTKDKGGDL